MRGSSTRTFVSRRYTDFGPEREHGAEGPVRTRCADEGGVRSSRGRGPRGSGSRKPSRGGSGAIGARQLPAALTPRTRALSTRSRSSSRTTGSRPARRCARIRERRSGRSHSPSWTSAGHRHQSRRAAALSLPGGRPPALVVEAPHESCDRDAERQLRLASKPLVHVGARAEEERDEGRRCNGVAAHGAVQHGVGPLGGRSGPRRAQSRDARDRPWPWIYYTRDI